jgi:hypothetical protein
MSERTIRTAQRTTGEEAAAIAAAIAAFEEDERSPGPAREASDPGRGN